MPLGVTFSFLITSPLSDMAAFLVLISIFGYKVAVAYMVLGVALGMVGGAIIQKLKMEAYVEDYVWQIHSQQLDIPEMTKRDRLEFCKTQVIEIVQRVWKFVLLGVGIGALVHNWIPQQWVETVLGGNSFFAPLIATMIGAPMYGDIFGTIPIAEALFTKGVGIGTVLSFMMAVTALSVPSIILLRKVVKPRLLWTFVGVVSGGILIIGYLFNAIGYMMI